MLPGLWHAKFASLLAPFGPWLVHVTGPDHPGYQLMLAFATDQLNGQLSSQVLFPRLPLLIQ